GTTNSDTVLVDAVILGVIANEPNGPVHILDDLRDGETRLAAMNHGENRVAAIDERPEICRGDRLVRGSKAAAHHEDNPRTVDLRSGREDIHRQGCAELSRVDDIFLAVKCRLIGADGRAGQESTGEQTQGDHGLGSFHEQVSSLVDIVRYL